jgi:hypothetical protein
MSPHLGVDLSAGVVSVGFDYDVGHVGGVAAIANDVF